MKMKFTKLFSSVRLFRPVDYSSVRNYCLSPGYADLPKCEKKGLILYVYEDNKKFQLTPPAEEVDKKLEGKISQKLNEINCGELTLGKALTFTDVHPDYEKVAIASIGPKDAGYNSLEKLDEARENLRWGTGAATRALHAAGCGAVYLAAPHSHDAAGEGSSLAAWSLQHFKSAAARRPKVKNIGSYGNVECDKLERGLEHARSQNWVRYLCETPANKMQPIDLAQEALDVLCPLGVTVEAFSRDWIEAQNMRAFLAVAAGSCTTPVLLQAVYNGKGGNSPPVLLVAKGVTFDSGGLCLKPCCSMTENRGSMAGAAVVLGAIHILAKLKVPINVCAVIPICDNMISGQCMKVGDVVQALNGLSIKIENTDMEGRLMMADALVYGQSVHKPSLVIDVATFTRGVMTATGGGAFGAFSNNEDVWRALEHAGAVTGDRPWRFPLWNYFQQQITNDPSVDLRNKGSGHATPCLGAAFLKNFVCGDWLHMDITGVGKLAHTGAPPYLQPGVMTGRPTRTIALMLHAMAEGKPDPTPPV